MGTKDRKTAKIRAISRRLTEIGENHEILLQMLDETKLDLLVIALGIGEVELPELGPVFGMEG